MLKHAATAASIGRPPSVPIALLLATLVPSEIREVQTRVDWRPRAETVEQRCPDLFEKPAGCHIECLQ